MKGKLLAGRLALVFALAGFGQRSGPGSSRGTGAGPGAMQYQPIAVK